MKKFFESIGLLLFILGVGGMSGAIELEQNIIPALILFIISIIIFSITERV